MGSFTTDNPAPSPRDAQYLGKQALRQAAEAGAVCADTRLAQVLGRLDVWRGPSRMAPLVMGMDTGFADLNTVLMGGGWPAGQLIELCLPAPMQGEWPLLRPVLAAQKGVVVLLNPPTLPFAQGWIQAGFNLNDVIVVKSASRNDFLFSFVELTRTKECTAIVAWQPQGTLSYTDLRKCLLAAEAGRGLYTLCRPLVAKEQSSPASLRLHVHMRARDLAVTVFKQKGALKQGGEPILLPLPNFWSGLPTHSQLDNAAIKGRSWAHPSVFTSHLKSSAEGE